MDNKESFSIPFEPTKMSFPVFSCDNNTFISNYAPVSQESLIELKEKLDRLDMKLREKECKDSYFDNLRKELKTLKGYR